MESLTETDAHFYCRRLTYACHAHLNQSTYTLITGRGTDVQSLMFGEGTNRCDYIEMSTKSFQTAVFPTLCTYNIGLWILIT